MATDAEDLEWVSDYVISFLKSPTWVLPIAQFVDERCVMFDDSEENKLEYTTYHNDFKHLVCDLFASHLLEVSVTPEQFGKFCQSGLGANSHLHHTLVEQLLSVDDFLTFKAMMAKQNADLDREAVLTIVDDEDEGPGSPTARVVHGLLQETLGQSADAAYNEWQFYEDQEMKAAMLASQSEYEGKQEADAHCDEADLERAIAMSLQLEEERLRQLEISVQLEEAGFDPTSGIPASAGFRSAPLAPPPFAQPDAVESVVPHILKMEPLDSAATPVPSAAGFTSSPLSYIQRPSVTETAPAPPAPPAPPAEVPDEPAAVESAPIMSAPSSLPPLQGRANLEAMRSSLQQNRQRAERVLSAPTQPAVAASPAAAPAAPPAPQPPMPGGPSAEERQQRAEHLRRQRDLLLQKRTRERENQLTEFNRGRAAQRAAMGTGAPGAEERNESADQRARRLVAELTPGAVVASDVAPPLAAGAEQMRQALTRQLRQSLVAGSAETSSLGNSLGRLEGLRHM